MQLTGAAEELYGLDWMDGSPDNIVTFVGSLHNCAELRAANRLPHDEATVTPANVSHD
jgi:hypothetical protein